MAKIVVHIEDNSYDQRRVNEAMKQFGEAVQLVSIATLQELTAYLESNQPCDLLISDGYVKPDFMNWEMRTVRKKIPGIPVVVYSGMDPSDWDASTYEKFFQKDDSDALDNLKQSVQELLGVR